MRESFFFRVGENSMSLGVIIVISLVAALFILGPILVAVGAAAWINDRFLTRK